MAKMRDFLGRFWQDETGQDMIEYGLVVAVMALGTIVTMNGLATNIGSFFGSVGTSLTTAV